MTQTVKNLPAMQETWVRSLGQKDLLEKEVATHSRILAWRIPWIEEPGGLSPWGLKEFDMAECTHVDTHTHTHTHTYTHTALLYSRNYHNIVKQLYSNKISLKKIEYIHKFFDTPPLKRWSPVSLPWSVG